MKLNPNQILQKPKNANDIVKISFLLDNCSLLQCGWKESGIVQENVDN